MQSVISVEF